MASMVKSVEYVEHVATTTADSVNLTQGQDYSNCVPFLSLHGGGDRMSNHCVDAYFSGTTESGIINFDRGNSSYGNVRIKCYVVEFEPTEVRVQQGTATGITNSVTQHTVASGVDPGKTCVYMYWKSTSSAQHWADHMVRYRMDAVSGTYVDTYRSSTGGSVDGHYFLFEDISTNNDHFIVDHETNDMTGTSQNENIPSGQRDVTKTIILGNWACTDTAPGNNYSQTVRFLPYFNSFSRADRNNGIGTIYWAVQHLTFKDDTKMYVPYIYYSGLTGSTTNSTASWSSYSKPCDLDTSCVIPTSPFGVARGETGGVSSRVAAIDALWVSFELETESSIRFIKNSTGYSNDACYFGWQVVDWAGITLSSGTESIPLDPDLTFVKSVENARLSVGGFFDSYELTKGQNWENCAVFTSYRNSGGSAEQREFRHTVWLREPGLVCAHRTDGGGTGVVDVSVVEFYPDQVRVQQGDWIHWSDTDARATFSGVASLDRAFTIFSWESNSTVSCARTNIRGRFIDVDEFQFYRYNTNDMIGGNFFVIEDLQDNFRVDHYIQTTTNTNMQRNSNKFNPYRSTIPIASYASSDDDDNAVDGAARVYHETEHSTVLVNKNSVGANTYASMQIVRFIDHPDRRRTQYMAPSMNTSTTSVTYDLSNQMTTNSGSLSVICPMQGSTGRNNSTAVASMQGSLHTARLVTNDTQVEITRESATGTLYSSYITPIDWIGYLHPDADEKGENIATAYPNKALVRSIEKFTGTSTVNDWYLSKGQIAANCVPFGSHRVGVDDARQPRGHRAYFIDAENNKVFTGQGAGGNGGDIDSLVYVVEFNPDRVKVQHIREVIPAPNTTTNVTIPEAIDTTRTMMWMSYCTTNYSTGWGTGLLHARITSSTNIEVKSTYNTESFTLSIFLMEALDDAWYVTRDNDTGSGSSTSIYSYGNFHYGQGNHMRFVQGSYRSSENDDNCLDQTFRIYQQGGAIHGMQWNRNAAGATIYYSTEMLEFNPDENIRVGGYYLDLSGSETSETKPLYDDTVLDVDRSIVAPCVMQSINRVDSSAVNAVSDVWCKLEITAENEITITKHNTSAQTYGFFQYVQWPEFRSHTFTGVVSEKGTPVSRKVTCYRSDTNELMDTTTSASGTGLYELQTTYSGEHYIIAQDDVPGIVYNDLILGRMTPDPITTFSGALT